MQICSKKYTRQKRNRDFRKKILKGKTEDKSMDGKITVRKGLSIPDN